MFSAMPEDGVEGRSVDALEDRTRLIKMRSVKNPVCDTPKASSVNAERIERASYKVEKRTRTLKTWFEGVSVDRVRKVLPDAVRKCAWQIPQRPVRPGRENQIDRPRGRPYDGQVSGFAELSHFRDARKAGDMSDLYGMRSWRFWKGTITLSSGHCRCTPARVRRCRPIWRLPENERWKRKLLTELNGEPWNTPPRQEEKPQVQDGLCIALIRQIKCGGQKGCMACCRHAGANPRDLRTRLQETVNNEVAQTNRQSKFKRLTRTNIAQFGQYGTMQSSSSGTAMAAGGSAPEDSNVVVAAVAESAMTLSTTSSTVREVATGNHLNNTERQRVLASESDRNGTIADVDTCRVIDLTTDPENCDALTQQVVDWNKNCCGAKS